MTSFMNEIPPLDSFQEDTFLDTSDDEIKWGGVHVTMVDENISEHHTKCLLSC